MDWPASKRKHGRPSFCLVLARSMSVINESAIWPDESPTGAAAVPHVVPAGSASPGDKIVEEVALGMSEEGLSKDGLGSEIEALRKEQQALKDQKKKIQKNLRNAVRKKKRLCDRARKLTDKDLVAVLMLRKNQRDARGQPSGSDGVGASRPSGGSETSRGSAAA